MSENDNCHCASTSEVVVKVIGMNAWRGKPCRQPWKTDMEGNILTSHVGADCSKYGSSNREGPIADGGQPCTTDIQRQWGSRSIIEGVSGCEIVRVLELISEIQQCWREGKDRAKGDGRKVSSKFILVRCSGCWTLRGKSSSWRTK